MVLLKVLAPVITSAATLVTDDYNEKWIARAVAG